MNTLPDEVTEIIEKMMHGIPQETLVRFGSKLRERYQVRDNVSQLETREEHLVYLACRLPATYAALFDVFHRLLEMNPEAHPESLLDLGAGPGTAFLAAREVFGSIKSTLLVERDQQFIDIGKKLIPDSSVSWMPCTIDEVKVVQSFDLVTISYALGEQDEEARERLIDLAFAKTKKWLVIVEPGTPHGYKAVIGARERLLGKGAQIVAPCPHSDACPMQGGDWCHFATRLSRGHLHRIAKGAALGFEDEKYSYIVMSREHDVSAHDNNRVVREPARRSGHVIVTLCTHNGQLEQKTISRRDKEHYCLAKKVEWGDILKDP